jgi:hypothetical protein
VRRDSCPSSGVNLKSFSEAGPSHQFLVARLLTDLGRIWQFTLLASCLRLHNVRFRGSWRWVGPMLALRRSRSWRGGSGGGLEALGAIGRRPTSTGLPAPAGCAVGFTLGQRPVIDAYVVLSRRVPWRRVPGRRLGAWALLCCGFLDESRLCNPPVSRSDREWRSGGTPADAVYRRSGAHPR